MTEGYVGVMGSVVNLFVNNSTNYIDIPIWMKKQNAGKNQGEWIHIQDTVGVCVVKILLFAFFIWVHLKLLKCALKVIKCLIVVVKMEGEVKTELKFIAWFKKAIRAQLAVSMMK